MLCTVCVCGVLCVACIGVGAGTMDKGGKNHIAIISPLFLTPPPIKLDSLEC